MARKSSGAARSAKRKRSAKKNSLVENINRRKRAGKSRPKSRSTVSKDSYSEMQRGWPSSRKRKSGRKSKSAKGASKKKR